MIAQLIRQLRQRGEDQGDAAVAHPGRGLPGADAVEVSAEVIHQVSRVNQAGGPRLHGGNGLLEGRHIRLPRHELAAKLLRGRHLARVARRHADSRLAQFAGHDEAGIDTLDVHALHSRGDGLGGREGEGVDSQAQLGVHHVVVHQRLHVRAGGLAEGVGSRGVGRQRREQRHLGQSGEDLGTGIFVFRAN